MGLIESLSAQAKEANRNMGGMESAIGVPEGIDINILKALQEMQSKTPQGGNVNSLAAYLAGKPASMDLIGSADAYAKPGGLAGMELNPQGLNEEDVRRNMAAEQMKLFK